MAAAQLASCTQSARLDSLSRSSQPPSLAARGAHAIQSVFEQIYDERATEAENFSGCTNASGTVGDRPFAVGSRITIRFGRRPECIRSTVWGGCQEYGPETPSTLRSTNLNVLAPDGDNWVFRGPGEATLVLDIGGVETLHTLRAEVATALDVSIVAQPRLQSGDGYTTAFASTLVPAMGGALLRGGTGGAILVRPIAADGRVLCGFPEVTVRASPGVDARSERLGTPFSVVATAAADTNAHLEVTAVGLTREVDLAVIDPNDLTGITLRELPSNDRDHLNHTFEVSVHAGELAVHGATVITTASGADDCTDVSFYFARNLPSHSRFHAQSFCGNDSEPTFRVSILEAPALGEDAVLRRL